jgi:hypothetical protein
MNSNNKITINCIDCGELDQIMFSFINNDEKINICSKCLLNPIMMILQKSFVLVNDDHDNFVVCSRSGDLILDA